MNFPFSLYYHNLLNKLNNKGLNMFISFFFSYLIKQGQLFQNDYKLCNHNYSHNYLKLYL